MRHGTEGRPRAFVGTAPAAAETLDHEGKSTNDARNIMSFMLDKDGIPRVTADRTDLQKRLELVQHLLRILSQTRLDDFLGRTALKLDLEKVRKLLKRYKSDVDLRLAIPAEYASVARYHEVVELVVYAEEQRFRHFALFLFDRFDLVQGSLADFLTRSAMHDFSSLGSSPDTRLAIRRARCNFSLVMLVVFGIPCMDAVHEARNFLVKDHLLHGNKDCYIFFVFNLAIAEVMRMFREGTNGDLIGGEGAGRDSTEDLESAHFLGCNLVVHQGDVRRGTMAAQV